MKMELDTDPELLDLALQMCRTNHANALARKDQAEDDIERWQRKIEKYENLVNIAMHKASVSGERTPTGRVPHGRSQQLITNFLQERNGTGASISAIAQATGTKYATVHRLIKTFEKANKVIQSRDKTWHWKSADSLI